MTTREKQTGTSNERLFWVLPDFYLIENVKSLPPLSPGAKFKVCARSSFDYIEYPVYGLRAALSQAENADQVTAGAPRIWQALRRGLRRRHHRGLHDPRRPPFDPRQDPRYYQLGKGSFWRRAGYAISYIFVTRADSGTIQFNATEIVGSALAAGISTYSYHPASDRTVQHSESVGQASRLRHEHCL